MSISFPGQIKRWTIPVLIAFTLLTGLAHQIIDFWARPVSLIAILSLLVIPPATWLIDQFYDEIIILSNTLRFRRKFILILFITILLTPVMLVREAKLPEVYQTLVISVLEGQVEIVELTAKDHPIEIDQAIAEAGWKYSDGSFVSQDSSLPLIVRFKTAADSPVKLILSTGRSSSSVSVSFNNQKISTINLDNVNGPHIKLLWADYRLGLPGWIIRWIIHITSITSFCLLIFLSLLLVILEPARFKVKVIATQVLTRLNKTGVDLRSWLPVRSRSFNLLLIFMLVSSGLIYLNRTGLIVPWKSTVISRSVPEQGHAFTADIDIPETTTIISHQDARLFEDETRLLEPSSAKHELIRDVGRGGNSVSGSFLYFSTSDNSDPRFNGRRYSLRYPLIVEDHTATTFYLLTMLILSLAALKFVLSLKQQNSQQTLFSLISTQYSTYLFRLFCLFHIIALLIFLNRSDLLTVWHTRSLSQITPEIGYAFTSPINKPSLSAHNLLLGQTQVEPRPRIFEDGSSLGIKENSFLDEIRTDGYGRYSFRDSHLYFSSSDRTDPINNGRQYTIQYPLVIEAAMALFFYIGSFLLLGKLLEIKYKVNVIIRIHIVSAGILICLITSRRLSNGNFDSPFAIGWKQQILSLLICLSCLFFLKRYYKSNNQIKTGNESTQMTPIILSRLFSLLPFAVYLLILVLPIPVYIVKDTEVPLMMLAGSLLYICFTRNFSRTELLAFTVIITVVALGIVRIWTLASPHGSAFGGLIPWNDALGYHKDGFSITAGLPADQSIRMNRIFHTGLIATLHGLTRINLQFTLAILGLLWAGVLYLTGREIAFSFGPLSGTIFIVLSLIYFFCWPAGTVLSENTGFLLGSFALTLLLRSIRTSSITLALFGILFQSLAINSRPGTYTIIPALIVWTIKTFQTNRPVRVILFSLMAGIIPFVINSIFNNYFSSSAIKFWYQGSMLRVLIWGLVTHRNPTMVDHLFPGIMLEDYDRVLRPIIIETFKNDPLYALSGLLSPYVKVYQPLTDLFFGFTGIIHNNAPITIAIYLLFLAGNLLIILRRRDNAYSLIGISFTGIFLSVPLIIFVGYRGFAATAPMIFALVSSGVNLLFRQSSLRQSDPERERKEGITAEPMLRWAFVILICFLAGPCLASIIKPNRAFSPVSVCEEKRMTVSWPLKGSAIRLVDHPSRNQLPDVSRELFLNNNPALGPDGLNSSQVGLKEAIEKLENNELLFVDPASLILITVPRELNIAMESPLEICSTDSIKDVFSRADSYRVRKDLLPVRTIIYWLAMVMTLICGHILWRWLSRRSKYLV